MEEFNVAYHHNIMVRCKKRLIVLMALDRQTDLYDDRNCDRTATLRHHLRQYTYIDYDYRANDWLDKLLYALPLHGLGPFQNMQRRGEEEDENRQDVDMLLQDRARGDHQPHSNYEGTDVLMLQRTTRIS